MTAPVIDLDTVPWTVDDRHTITLLCPSCETEASVAITGRLRPHAGPDGQPCDHSGARVQKMETAA